MCIRAPTGQGVCQAPHMTPALWFALARMCVMWHKLTCPLAAATLICSTTQY